MSSQEKSGDLNGGFSETSEVVRREEAKDADDAASQESPDSIGLTASLFVGHNCLPCDMLLTELVQGITFSYLPVFSAPLLVSLGLQVLQQAYGMPLCL